MLVGAFNQEKALVGAFSVIVKTDCGTDGALPSTNVCNSEYYVLASQHIQFIVQIQKIKTVSCLHKLISN